MGLMTPTHRPETGCPECLKGQFCYEHGYRVMLDQLLTLWHDIVRLLSEVPCHQEYGYVDRYEWLLGLLEHIQQSTRPKRLTTAVLACTRRLVVNL